MLTVTLVGRPNVGKSTLFNRITGGKAALVADRPGVTRDRREGDAQIGPLHFRAIDTAGLEEAETGSLSARMTEQTLAAVKHADVTLLLVDGRAGITPEDRHFAALLRKTGAKVIVAVNKAESAAAAQAALAEAYGLGFGEPIAMSAEHGEGMGELYEVLSSLASEEETGEQPTTSNQQLTLAIIGRPNAGKSTLVNRLLGEERLLAGPEAGITRDAIAVPFEYEGRALTLVDTAGLRKRARITDAVEKLSAGDATRAIRRADVAVVLMDATLAFEKQDVQLAELAAREGKAVVLAVSKWDLVPQDKREQYLADARARTEIMLPQLRGIPIVPVSAHLHQKRNGNSGLKALMEAVFRAHKLWETRISTGKLNHWLEAALATHAPPLIKGRRLKIRYLTQVDARPPSFALFCNLKTLPGHYERYLVGSLRDAFALRGIPIRLMIRTGKNPYAEDEK